MRHEAIRLLYSNAVTIDDAAGVFDSDGNKVMIDESLVNTQIAELEAAEPMRLLRIERDRLLQQTDWEIQRNAERNIDSTELITYRNALRDLPQEIESGNISAPTLDDQGNLIFDNWPVRGE